MREHNPYVEAFWSWWPELYPKLKHFRMTGGEPLMDENTYRVFDYVLALPLHGLHLAVTSNFSVEERLMQRYLGAVKQLCNTQIEHFMQYVSLDSGIAQQAEYIRYGLEFERCLTNVDSYLAQVPNRNSLTFIITMNNLNVTGLQDLLEYILTLRARHSHTYQRVWFDTPLLRYPSWQSLQILPESYQFKLEKIVKFMRDNLMPDDSFVGFKDYEIQRMERNLEWMREPQDQDRLSRDRGDFYRFFEEHDKRRATDFLYTFPEMREFWSLCQYHAKAI